MSSVLSNSLYVCVCVCCYAVQGMRSVHKHRHTHVHISKHTKAPNKHIPPNTDTNSRPYALPEMVFNMAVPVVLPGWRNVTVWPSLSASGPKPTNPCRDPHQTQPGAATSSAQVNWGTPLCLCCIVGRLYEISICLQIRQMMMVWRGRLGSIADLLTGSTVSQPWRHVS